MRSKNPARLTKAQRRQHVATWIRLCDNGAYPADVEKKLGFSESTLRRWAAQEQRDQRASRRLHRLPMIEKAISTLVSPEAATAAEQLIAIFRFIRWMRWPEEDNANATAVIACFAAYYRIKLDARNLGDFDKSSRRSFFDLLNFEFFEALCYDDLSAYPKLREEFDTFSSATNDESTYSPQDILAESIRYLLADPKSHYHRKRHTRTKAVGLLVDGGLRIQTNIGSQAYWGIWHDYGSASPYLFIAKNSLSYNLNLNIDFDPLAENFLYNVNRILENIGEFREYFAECKWAFERLQTRLEAKVWRSLAIPQLPFSLQSSELEPPALF